MGALAVDNPLDASLENGVLTLTLNRPERLNALNDALVNALSTTFRQLTRRPEVRVVILKAAGSAFCAGLDLKDVSGTPPGELRLVDSLDRQRAIADIVVAMRRCPQPIIAAVQGAASGGGFAMALASDVRIVEPQTRMNAAFIKVGLSGCDIGVSYFLPRMVGHSMASEYMLTGNFIGAERAFQLGLVSRIVEASILDAEARTLASQMLRATPAALRMTKEALNFSIDAGGLEAAIAMEDRNQVLTSRDPDFTEAVSAFLEKRRPGYSTG